MAERLIHNDLAKEIVRDAAQLVGAVGTQEVGFKEEGRDRIIKVSRGGIVLPGNKILDIFDAAIGAALFGDDTPEVLSLGPPVYHPEIVAISDLVGYRNSADKQIDPKNSHVYVLHSPAPEKWHVHDAIDSNFSDPHDESLRQFHLGESRPVTTEVEGLAIKGLLATFMRMHDARIRDGLFRATPRPKTS